MESWDPNLVKKEINRAVDEGLKQRDHRSGSWKSFFFFSWNQGETSEGKRERLGFLSVTVAQSR